ncbi:MAG TPA: hypothetical protein P5556_10120 [Candidatus Gastranaerophilales bacterium]|nr:hypothetical protein [Candidatus Gastranaerophilales bacterium]
MQKKSVFFKNSSAFDSFSNIENEKNSFLYELALQRGKKRGWYPVNWNLQDYLTYLFKREFKITP